MAIKLLLNFLYWIGRDILKRAFEFSSQVQRTKIFVENKIKEVTKVQRT